jgi:hypothetical protein
MQYVREMNAVNVKGGKDNAEYFAFGGMRLQNDLLSPDFFNVQMEFFKAALYVYFYRSMPSSPKQFFTPNVR